MVNYSRRHQLHSEFALPLLFEALLLLGFGVLGATQASMWDTPLALTNVLGFTAVWALGYGLARWMEKQLRRVTDVERREALARDIWAQPRARGEREAMRAIATTRASLDA